MCVCVCVLVMMFAWRSSGLLRSGCLNPGWTNYKTLQGFVDNLLFPHSIPPSRKTSRTYAACIQRRYYSQSLCGSSTITG